MSRAAPPGTGPQTASARLAPNIMAAYADGGRIAENIVHFARVLRAAGLPVGPEKTVRATEAVLAAGITDPKILFWTLHAVFVNRRGEHEVFTQAYVMFWKDPAFLEQMMSLMLPSFRPGIDQAGEQALSRRVAESLFRGRGQEAPKAGETIEIEAIGTYSDQETLAAKDFEQMSAAELAEARRAIERLRLPFEEVRTRRLEPAGRGGRLDVRAMLRDAARHGGELAAPRYRRPRWRRPPIVVLCDISGSMDTYARIFLHFLHALTGDRDRVHTFLFATRLTNVTRALSARDPDVAIAKVGSAVTDWSGGTRIGAALDQFNRLWARRVLGQNALVLLFTDGLDRDDAAGIEEAARRLRASCRRLVWLNPLLRFDEYRPLAAGAGVLSRYANETRACHNLSSLRDLAAALSA